MTTRTARRMDGYIRVSRLNGRDGERFISSDVQRERIELAAKGAGAEIAEWFVDLDESGGKMDRPTFQLALERVEDGRSDGLVVAKLDRFARSVLHARQALERIEAAGGSVISAEDGFDSSTPMGRFATTMIFALAELELERVRESWTTARVYAARRGVHMAKVPVGYDRGDDGRLVPNNDAPTIAEAFRARGGGANWTQIARLLDERGVTPGARKAAGHWATASVRTLLRNRVYLGEIRAGDVVNPRAHAPLVTLAEFEAAQAGRGTSVARSTEPALLAGLLRCASCRHVMKPKKSTAGGRVYRCSRDYSSGVCPAPATINASVVEPYAERLLLDRAAARTYRPERLTAEAEEAERDVARHDAELRAWVTDEEIAGLMTRELYLEGLQARQQRLDDATARRRSLFAKAADNLPGPLILRDLWPTLSRTERRRVLGAAFDALVVRPNGRRPVTERVVALSRGEAPADLPGRGKRVPFRAFDLPPLTKTAQAPTR